MMNDFQNFCLSLQRKHMRILSEIMLKPKLILSKERLDYIDWAKTFCIFFMVIGHYTENRIVLSYIFSFHMPAFFIISGFLYKPHSWKQTIIAFTVPVVFFSLLNLLLRLILGIVTLESLSIWEVTKQIVNWRHGLDGLFKGLWFIWALVGLRFLFGDLFWMKAIRKYHVPIALIIVIYMTLEKYHVDIDTLFRGYYVGTIIPSLPFFSFGLFLKDIQWNPNNIRSFFFAPVILLFLILPFTNNYCDIYNSNYGYSYLIAAINAILFSMLLFWVSNKLHACIFIQTISEGTLIVLGMHMPLLIIQQRLLPNSISFLFPFLTIIVCYCVIIFCRRYCPILLGKTNQNRTL